MRYYCKFCGESQTREEFDKNRWKDKVICQGCDNIYSANEYLVSIKDVKKHIFIALVGSELRE